MRYKCSSADCVSMPSIVGPANTKICCPICRNLMIELEEKSCEHEIKLSPRSFRSATPSPSLRPRPVLPTALVAPDPDEFRQRRQLLSAREPRLFIHFIWVGNCKIPGLQH